MNSHPSFKRAARLPLLGWAVIAGVLALSLTACGGDSSDPPAGNAPSTSTPGATPPGSAAPPEAAKTTLHCAP